VVRSSPKSNPKSTTPKSIPELPPKAPKSTRFWLYVGVGLALALLLGLGLRPALMCRALCSVLVWVQTQGIMGVIGYVVIYNLATVLLLPGALLTLSGGAIYGVVWGSVYATVAAFLGATLAFAIGRYWARGAVCRRLRRHPHFQLLDAAVMQSGAKLVFLTRLSPLLPFNLLNYAYGVTRVSLPHYLIGSLGMLPGTVLYVYMGALIGDVATLETAHPMSASAQGLQMGLHGVGLLATAAVTVMISRYAKRTLQQTVPPLSAEDEMP
jgi:uncharacterized membrane protein YdjX (TVP38/TMEM64 family)